MGAHYHPIRSILVVMAALAAACGATPRRPKMPPGKTVEDLRRSAGSGVQDCGEATESTTDTACRVHSVGECLLAALHDCRPAYGMRSFFTSEGDAVRQDWLVMSDGRGGCNVVTVDDRSADPLARKTPALRRCTAIVWKHHESIADCEAPVPDGCHDVAADEPKKHRESDESNKSDESDESDKSDESDGPDESNEPRSRGAAHGK